MAGTLAFAAFASMQAMAADSVVVSSKIDTEGGVLGNIILQALKANNIPVESKISWAQTYRPPGDHTGADRYLSGIYRQRRVLLQLGRSSGLEQGRRGYAKAKELDYDANKIVWLTPAKANNTWAIAVRGDVADATSFRTLSDFGAYVAKGDQVKLAASSEFVTSPSALPAFEKAYGFKMKPDQLITLSGVDTGRHDLGGRTADLGRERRDGLRHDGGIAPPSV